MSRRLRLVLGSVLAAVALVLATALPAWAASTITLTWVRHAESTANAAGIIDTRIPGPGLTALGETQAQTIAATLAGNLSAHYDGIFVSDMQRTALTAAPLATALGLTPQVEGGVREINAGLFEGGSGPVAGIGYALPPLLWTLGARFVPVLGGENGNGFEARVDEALAAIAATGATDPVVFSHGATIMAWTLMNVANPDFLLAVTRPLGNTAVVVVSGNPEDGWTLESWDGVAVDPNPGLLTKLFVDARALVVAPQTSLYAIGQALRTGDPSIIAAAIRDGVVHVLTATVDFGKAVIRDVVGAVTGVLSPGPGPAATTVAHAAAAAPAPAVAVERAAAARTSVRVSPAAPRSRTARPGDAARAVSPAAAQPRTAGKRAAVPAPARATARAQHRDAA